MKKPVIAITMGDPAGIGPEITAKLLAKPDTYERCKPLVIGSARHMARYAEHVNAVSAVEQSRFEAGRIDVLETGPALDTLELGKVTALGGQAAFQYVTQAIRLAMDKAVDATVTNALSKEAIHLAGHHYAGHTEIYAEFTNTKKYTMLLAHENLRVVHVSTHVSLREACDRVKKERVLDVIRIARDACVRLGIPSPVVGVAGLNPHSGENGMFGCEEISEIIPAIEAAKAEGIQVEGPVPPDSLFPKAVGGWYDIVVAMYHDQGHIPLKTVGFTFDRTGMKAASGVNITLGLPIIRTSVDHGTAFDLAGTGRASELSLQNALTYAISLACNR